MLLEGTACASWALLTCAREVGRNGSSGLLPAYINAVPDRKTMKLFFFPAWEPLGKVRAVLLQPGFPLMATFLISTALPSWRHSGFGV